MRESRLTFRRTISNSGFSIWFELVTTVETIFLIGE